MKRVNEVSLNIANPASVTVEYGVRDEKQIGIKASLITVMSLSFCLSGVGRLVVGQLVWSVSLS